MSKKTTVSNQGLTARLQRIVGEVYGGKVSKMANAAGIPDPSIRNWLRRKTPPNADAVDKICQAAGVSAAWLISGEGPMYMVDIEVDPTATYTLREAEKLLGGLLFGDEAHRLSGVFIIEARKELSRLLKEEKKLLTNGKCDKGTK